MKLDELALCTREEFEKVLEKLKEGKDRSEIIEETVNIL